MAWYKDPDTEEIKEVDLFEKNNETISSIKSLQSTMLVVPFNVPYQATGITLPGQSTGIYADTSTTSATYVSQVKGLRWVPFLTALTSRWMPLNMYINNSKTLDNLEFYRTATDFFDVLYFTSQKFSNITQNRTLFKNNTQFKFNMAANQNMSDPIRWKGRFSYLLEKTLKWGHVDKDIQYSFNTYDVYFNKPFAKKSDSAWWIKDGVPKDFIEGTFQSEISVKEGNPGLQYSAGILLMEEKITIKGSDNSEDNNWNPIISNFIGYSGAPTENNLKNWTKHKSGIVMPNSNIAGSWSFRDATFEIKKPFLEKAYESGEKQDMGLTSPVDIQAHYNFYLLPYEDAISDEEGESQVRVPLEFDGDTLSPIPEPMIPNIYALIYDQMSEEEYFRYSDQGSWMPLGAFKHCKKSNGSLNYTGKKAGMPLDKNEKFLVDGLGQFLSITTKKNHVDELPVKNIAEYLNSWVSMAGALNAPPGPGGETPAYKKWDATWAGGYNAENIAHAIKNAAMMNKEGKYNIVGISAYKIKDLTDEADKLKKMFPFHIDINLPMANSGYIGKLLFDGGLTDIFMQNIMAGFYHIGNAENPSSADKMSPAEVKDFYSDIKPFTTPALKNTCIIRKDGPSHKSKGGSPKQETMFSETMLHLWLNEFLESKVLLDLDAAPALIGAEPTLAPFAQYFEGLPPQYYDWISDVGAYDYIKQVLKLLGFAAASWNKNLLKPVVFGKAPPKSSNSISALIKWILTKNKINKFINERVRSVSDVYAGKKAYSEVLFYEIVKYKSQPIIQENLPPSDDENDIPYIPASGPDTKGETFIQSFFIPNIPGMDMAKYVDTQVKHDKGYYYQIYAHTFVIGTQYQYDAQQGHFKGKAYDELNGKFHRITLDCDYKPDVHLIRVPFYNTIASTSNTVHLAEYKDQSFDNNNSDNYKLNSLETTLVWDSPPIFPDAVFVPLYGENDRVLINCNFNVGEYDLNPVILDKNSDELNAQIKPRINQKKLKGPITFSGDDFCGHIEILRIDKKPTSYLDFTPTDKTAIAEVGHGKSNFGFYDRIEPNKDYYYVIREVDVHGNYSNPSPIYMARIVDREAEAPYTIFKMFFIEEMEEAKPVSTKSFMKYIKIQPSLEQRVLNDLEISDYSSIDLLKDAEKLNLMIGDLNLSKNVWGKKFKFRFTSKKTGRKFDLNLAVKDIDKLEKETSSVSGEPDTYSSGKC